MSFVARNDYGYPIRIDGGAQRAGQAPYAAHVEQMVEQVLLTAPGERVDLPDFGCGLRQLVFAPMYDSLGPALQLQITQALGRWLSDTIAVVSVDVETSADDASLAEGTVAVTVTYTLLDTQTTEQTTVLLP